MAYGLWIPLAALAISVVTFVATRVDRRQTARHDWVEELQDRIRACENDRRHLSQRLDEVRESELWLTRRVWRLEQELERRAPASGA